MSSQYLALAKQGKNDFWRYIIAIPTILFFWLIVGTIPTVILIFLVSRDQDPGTQLNPETFTIDGLKPLTSYLVTNFNIIVILIGLYVAVRFLHQRRLITLLNANGKVRWVRLWQGFWVYFMLLAVATFIRAVLLPEQYQFSLNLNELLLFIPIAFVLTPIQAGTEELLFRGYLMQGIGSLTRIKTIPVVLSALLFVLPHLRNPEISQGFLLLSSFYFLFGIFSAFITIKDNGLELAIGAHSANNLFIVLFANYADTALPSPAVFTFEFDPVLALFSFILIAITFCLITLNRRSLQSG